jgi:hypothetical protein
MATKTISLLYANDFSEIPAALANNEAIFSRMLELVTKDPILDKAVEGSSRLAHFRGVLERLTIGKKNIHQAIREAEERLPRDTSPHAENNYVFASKWAERLVRTQYSRFYNQAVLEQLLAEGKRRCRVPHSKSESRTSPCTVHLAGTTQMVKTLHDRLIRTYHLGESSEQPLVPNHPHCTHVVIPA